MAEKTDKTFGTRLRIARELHGLNQTELADRAGLTPAAISQLEADDRLPAFKTLTVLAEALHTSVGALLGEENPTVPPKLQAFFRDLDALGSADIAKVREYAALLHAQKKGKLK